MALTKLTDIRKSLSIEAEDLQVNGITTFTGNVSIGGTLTYQDVTNIDSVGVITARSTIDAQGAINLADSIIHTGDTNTKIRFPEADNFTVECAGNERFRVKPTNDIAVFTGSNSGTLTIRNDTSNEVQIHSGGSDALILGSGGENERLRITSAGSVGINETSPDRKLHVRSDGAAAAKLGGESGSAYYMEIGQLASSGSPGFNATGSSTSMLFQLNGSEKVRIDSSGRLLVATNSASAANSGADDLVIGNTSQGNNGMSIVTNNANIGAIFFADQDNSVRGGVRYQHASDLAQFYAGGSVVLNLKNKGVGINETSPASDALIIRGGDTDDTPSLILKRATDGTQSAGEIIGKLQFMSNENNVDSGNYQPRVEIKGETTDTVGGAAMVLSTAAGSATSPTERLRITSDGSTQINSGVLQRRYESTNTAGYRYYTKAERFLAPNGGSGLNFTITGMTQGWASIRFGGYTEGNRVNFRADLAGYNAGNSGVRIYDSNEITNQATAYAGGASCSITVTKNNASYVVNVTQSNPQGSAMAGFYYFESGGYNSVSTLTVA